MILEGEKIKTIFYQYQYEELVVKFFISCGWSTKDGWNKEKPN